MWKRKSLKLGAGALCIAALASTSHAIPINPLAWFKASAVSATDGQLIGTWNDSSGNGFNAAQLAPGNQPQYVTNGINGYPSIRFAGNQSMEVPGSELPASPLNITGNVSMAVLIKGTNYTGERAIAGNFQSFDGSGYMMYERAEDAYIGYSGGIALTPADSSDADVNRPTVLTFIEGASLELYVDTTLAATGAANNTFDASTQPFRIGTLPGVGGNFIGDMTEIIVWDRTLTNEERVSLFSYFMHTYDLPEPSTAAAALGLSMAVVLRRKRH